jgi:hypothetical protein
VARSAVSHALAKPSRKVRVRAVRAVRERGGIVRQRGGRTDVSLRCVRKSQGWRRRCLAHQRELKHRQGAGIAVALLPHRGVLSRVAGQNCSKKAMAAMWYSSELQPYLLICAHRAAWSLQP